MDLKYSSVYLFLDVNGESHFNNSTDALWANYCFLSWPGSPGLPELHTISGRQPRRCDGIHFCRLSLQMSRT